MIRAALACALLMAGCASSEPGRGWEIAGQGELALPALPVVGAPRREADRIAYALAGELRLAMQRTDTTSRLPTGERRDASTVAAALVTRLELGERAGELTSTPCTVLGHMASCVSGWIERDGRRYARDGAIFVVGDQVVWLDVTGPNERAEHVRDTADRVRAGLEWRPS